MHRCYLQFLDMDCNDVVLPSCVSSSLCHTLFLMSGRSSHWRKSGVCVSWYACGTSLALVMHFHLLTQSTPAHSNAMVVIMNILFGTTCVYTLSTISVHAVDCNDVVLPSCVSSSLCHTLILRSGRSSHWRKSRACASGYACGTSLALVVHLHLLNQRTPMQWLSSWNYLHVYVYMQVAEVKIF